jgi:general secretion pathway protein A
MYEEFFSYFGLRANPFHVSPDPRFYIPTPAYESALSEIKYGIETRQGLMVLTGEAGTGKTTLLQMLLEWLHGSGHSSSYIFHSLLEPADLFAFVLRDFGISCASTEKGKVLQSLHQWLIQRHAQGDTPVIVIDEAQVLPSRTLDELRLLLNLETPDGKLVQIVLAGQQELESKLRQPELRQLRQRIVFHSRIAKMTLEETTNYISSRLASAGGNSDIFSVAALEGIHTFSSGIPRVVNLLCEHSLIGAYAAQQQNISREIVQRVAADFDLAAKPMAWENPAEASKYSRLMLFPMTEAKIASAAAAAKMASASPAASAQMIYPEQVAMAAEASAGAQFSSVNVQQRPASPVTDARPIVESRLAANSFAATSANTAEAPAMVSEIAQVQMPRWRKVSYGPSFGSSFLPTLKSYFHAARKVSLHAGARIQSAWPAVWPYFDSIRKYFADVVQSFVQDWRAWMAPGSKTGITTRKSELPAKFQARKSRRKTIQKNVVTPLTAWLKQPIANAQGVARLPKKHL